MTRTGCSTPATRSQAESASPGRVRGSCAGGALLCVTASPAWHVFPKPMMATFDVPPMCTPQSLGAG
jgi:hypothetical protein